MELAVTNQTDRGCGWCWCWHVCVEGLLDGGTIGQGGYMPSAEAAMAAANTWARMYCERTLAGIAAAIEPR
jgi:hypothetical protein